MGQENVFSRGARQPSIFFGVSEQLQNRIFSFLRQREGKLLIDGEGSTQRREEERVLTSPLFFECSFGIDKLCSICAFALEGSPNET